MPTLKELGYPKLVETTWFALSGHARMPASIVQRINREVIKALTSPQVQKQLERDVLLTQPMTPQQFTEFVRGQIDLWGPIALEVSKSTR